jgi:hypothetical protein
MRDECITYLPTIIYNKIALKCHSSDLHERFSGCESPEEGELIPRFAVIILVVHREGLPKWILSHF